MKYPVMLAGVLCCFTLLSQPVSAAPYIDNMGNMADSDFRYCDKNLIHVTRGQNMEDNDAYQLMVQPDNDGNYIGAVRYQLQGAQALSLRIYSPTGTYVGEDLQGSLQMGKDSSLDIKPDPKGVLQALFSPGDRNIYVWHGGWQVLGLEPLRGHLAFLQAPAGFEGQGLVNYGVNVYASLGNPSHRTLLPLTRTCIEIKAIDKNIFVLEDFSCNSIPTGVRYLWVELNDLGGTMLNGNNIRTSIAWVSINGNQLQLGPPKAEPQTSYPSAAQDTQGSGSSPAAGSSSKGSSSSKTQPSDSPKAASSKFEGIITSSQPGSRAQKSSPATPFSSSGSSSSPQASGQLLSPVPDFLSGEAGPSVYEITRQGLPADDAFEAGVIFYVVLVALTVIYLLIRPRK